VLLEHLRGAERHPDLPESDNLLVHRGDGRTFRLQLNVFEV